jgi:predicted transcriptional regulator
MERRTMPTTTIKLPDTLRERIARAAEDSGVSPHAFMIEAIEARTELAERRREWIGAALKAEEQVARYGLVYDGDEVLAWMGERLAGHKMDPPAKRKL